MRTNTGVIIGALGFRNPYDGNTLEPVLVQVARPRSKPPKTATVDRGYKGKTKVDETKILPPKSPSKKRTRYQSQKLRKAHQRRAAIELIIGHLKQDHRLGRNFYKGIKGGNIRIMLAAAAFNLKRVMNRIGSSFFGLFEKVVLLAYENLKSFFQPKNRVFWGF